MSISIQIIGVNDERLARMTDELPADQSSISVKASVGGVNEAAAQVRSDPPDLLVIDSDRLTDSDLAVLETSLSAAPSTTTVLLANDRSSDFLIRAMRAGIREVVPWPSAQGELGAALLRHLGRLGAQRLGVSSAHVLGFVPAKGGSGATFVAANVAAELAARGARTLLVDLNAPFGDAALHLSEDRPTAGLADLARQLSRLDPTLLESVAAHPLDGLSLLAAPDSIERYEQVGVDAIERILAIASARFRFVVLDLGRAVDPVSVRGLDRSDELFLITQLSLPYLHAARRTLDLFGGLGYPPERIKVVVNRFERDVDLSPTQAENLLGVPIAHRIPNSYRAVGWAINHGEPIRRSAPRDPVSRAVSEFVDQLYPGGEPGGRGGSAPRRFWH